MLLLRMPSSKVKVVRWSVVIESDATEGFCETVSQATSSLANVQGEAERASDVMNYIG